MHIDWLSVATYGIAFLAMFIMWDATRDRRPKKKK